VAGPFRTFWFGGPLSPLEHLCAKSFLANGHRFQLYAYEEVENVPDGCELLDAATIVPRDRLFLYAHGDHAGTPAGFANLFRYTLLDRHGGWWVDSDVLCLRSKIAEPDYVFAMQDDHYYNVAILRAPAGGRLIRAALERATERVEAQGGNIPFGSIGPNMFTELVPELGFEDKAVERAELYPIPYWQGLFTCDPALRGNVERRAADSTFVHLWTGTFRGAGVPTTARPPAGSYLADMYERYEVPFPDETEFDWWSVLLPRRPGWEMAYTPVPRFTPLPGRSAQPGRRPDA
jgi:hypothetical protein